jgi:hypothetical protein
MKEGLILSLMSQIFINAARLFSKDLIFWLLLPVFLILNIIRILKTLLKNILQKQKSIAYYASLLGFPQTPEQDRTDCGSENSHRCYYRKSSAGSQKNADVSG